MAKVIGVVDIGAFGLIVEPMEPNFYDGAAITVGGALTRINCTFVSSFMEKDHPMACTLYPLHAQGKIGDEVMGLALNLPELEIGLKQRREMLAGMEA